VGDGEARLFSPDFRNHSHANTIATLQARAARFKKKWKSFEAKLRS